MSVVDFIILAVFLVILGGVIAYLVHRKKSGANCIGCDASSCHCGCKNKDEKPS